jgi:hypothetical protein
VDHWELEGALQVAEHGLALQPPPTTNDFMSYAAEHDKAGLAAWTTELAAGMGLRDRALRAAEVAFRVVPSLVAYLKAQELADERWDTIKPQLLTQQQHSPAPRLGHMPVAYDESARRFDIVHY